MFKHYKTWFSLAGIFIISGILICTIMLAINRFDLTSLNTDPERVKKECQVSRDKAVNLTIETSANDVILKKSEDNNIMVTYYESEELTYDIVNADTGKNIVIAEKDNRKWYQMIDVNFGVMETPLTVEIPEEDWKNIKIATSSGDIDLSEIKGKNIYVKTSSGDVSAYDIQPNYLDLESSSGYIRLNDFFVSDELVINTLSGDTELSKIVSNDTKINSTSGDVKLSKAESPRFEIETSSGDIRGTIRGDQNNVFEVESLSGEISVPSSEKEGETLFSAVTTSGDIKIKFS